MEKRASRSLDILRENVRLIDDCRFRSSSDIFRPKSKTCEVYQMISQNNNRGIVIFPCRLQCLYSGKHVVPHGA